MTSIQKIKSLASWAVGRSSRAAALMVATLLLVWSAVGTPSFAQGTEGFDHSTTLFPLSGLHEQVRCEACHIKGIFKGTPRDCGGCHIENNPRGAKAKSVNHIQSSNSCEECHSVTSFTGAHFNHISVAAGSCGGCHDGRRATGRTPNHFPTAASCDRCHGTSSFKNLQWFDHRELNGDLGTCASCHDGVKAKGKPTNHLPQSADALCASCHVLSTQTGFTSFAGGQMDHTGMTSGCADCHGPNITGASFVGVTNIIAMPPTSQAGPRSHIPSSTACENCHLQDTPKGLVAANAVNGVPGSDFGKSPQQAKLRIHEGVTSGCSNCHETNFTWLGMSNYPPTPATFVAKAQYTGFHARPTAAGGQFAVADANHPSTGDCSDCHAGTTYFSGEVKPANHIPTSGSANCNTCHTSSDYAAMPTLANIHKYAPNSKGGCLQCHGNASLNGGQPASYYAIPEINFNIKALPDNHVPYTAGQECQVCHTSIAVPVVDGATFANSKMVHSATNSACDVCHGASVTNTTFAGVTKIVVLPPTSPAGANSHMPLGTVTKCDACHALTAPATAMPGVATSTTPGNTGFYPGNGTNKPDSNAVHSGISKSNCNQCHADGMVWMSVTGPWPMTPATFTVGTTAYKGFQTLPKAAGSTTNIADQYHPAASAGDCSKCHTSTDAFDLPMPTNHMPYKAGTACATCHTTANWSTMPALTPIHANTVTGATCASCHAKAVASSFLSSAAFVADGTNHIPFNSTADCAVCHVGSAASIKALPVVTGAKFSGSGMAHSATTASCDTCHGATVKANDFQGVTAIIVLPKTSPAGTTSHIPTTAPCEQCHALTTLAAQVPGVATKTVPGTGFATPAAKTAQIHAGISGNCAQCHDTGMNWMGMDTYYPMTPKTKSSVSGTKYNGFHSRPTSAGSLHAIADSTHPTTGECADCHSSFDAWTGVDTPVNHIPFAATAQCTSCHTSTNFAVSPTVTNIHKYAQSTTGNCLQCHGNATLNSGKPASYYAISKNNFSIKALPDNHLPYTAGKECMACHNNITTPVTDGASFANSNMAHSATSSSCATCHGASVTGTTFAGVTSIVVLPQTTPMGANSHIPTTAACDQCHKLTGVPALVPGVATKTVGTGATLFGSGAAVLPTSANIHAGMTGGCASCHEANYTWMGMSAYPVNANTIQADLAFQYRGFQTRPTAAGGPNSVRDTAHGGSAATGDCQTCHSEALGFVYFSATAVVPTNHIPYATGAACGACHTAGDYSTQPSLTNIHKYAQSTTGNCLQCHGNATLNSGKPASYYAIAANNFSIKALPDNHVPYTAGQECQVCHTSIAVPVVNGATFANSKMVHSATNSACDVCHGASVTNTTFAGVTKIVVLPPTSPAGANSHMPLGTVTKCDACHALTAPATAMPGVATSTTPGNTGFYPGNGTNKPDSNAVHSGISKSNCNQCHADGMVWMSVTGPWPMTPATFTVGTTAYKGFQTLPKAAGSTTNIADQYHPAASAGDCSKCHTSTDAFDLPMPTNHMPYKAGTACATCHTTANWSTMPALTPIHANTVTGATCASCHAKAVASSFLSSAAFVADGTNHIPFNSTADCAVCHVGSAASIKALPVVDGAKFSGSGMTHSAATATACSVCHGSTVTGTTYQGVTSMVVLPQMAPMGASSHIPSTAACDQCHKLTGVPAMVPGVATATAGTGATLFGTGAAVLPTSANIHAGMTSGCMGCHEANYTWMGMSAYPVNANTVQVDPAYQYRGFQTRPTSAGGTNSVRDSAHNGSAAINDCATCHSEALGFVYFSGSVKPDNHIPYLASAACSACHTGADYSVMPTWTNIHKNAQSTTGNCLQCHGNATLNGGKPASYYAIPSANFSIKALPDNHVPYTAGQECQVCHTSIAVPVVNGATFANSKMVHSATNSACDVCHGASVTATTFAGVTKIVVLPPTSPAGANSHMPLGTVTKCDACHALTAPATAMAGVATSTTPGSTGFYPGSVTSKPSSAQVHAGITTTNCNQCHADGMVWMSVTGPWPMTPATFTVGTTAYKGFQTLPKAAGSTTNIADQYHPAASAGDCSKCHTSTDAFDLPMPTNHMPYKAGTACATCHTTANWSTMPALTPIHANTVTGATCASCHAKAVASSFLSSAAFVADGTNHIPFNSTADCAVCHVGTGSSITALPVVNGAKFSGSAIAHTAVTSTACAVCHGSTVTGTTFQGITKIVVMPPSATPGTSSHIPSTAACDACHVNETPSGLVAGNAASTTVPGTGFGTVTVLGTAIHNGVSTCNACHNTGMVWLGVGKYTRTPTTKSADPATKYYGFNSRPTTAGSTYAIADAAHATGGAATDDCSVCHQGTSFFTGAAAPTGHIPLTYGTGVCSVCHIKTGDYSIAGLASTTVLHTGMSLTTNCKACHVDGASAAPFVSCATQATCTTPLTKTYRPKQMPLSGSAATPSTATHIYVGTANCGDACHKTFSLFSDGTRKMFKDAPSHVQAYNGLVAAGVAEPCRACHKSSLWYGITKNSASNNAPNGFVAKNHESGDCIKCHKGGVTNVTPATHPYDWFGQSGNTTHAARVRPVLRAALIGSRPQLAVPGTTEADEAVAGGNAAAFNHRGVLPGNCTSCHNGQMAKGLPAKHLVTHSSCDACHRNTAWKPAEFSHQGVPQGQCQSCHNGQNGPGKLAGHFVTSRSCDACHKVVAWVPVIYSHTSPLYQMQPDKTTCLSCHITNGEIIPRQMRGGTRPRPQ